MKILSLTGRHFRSVFFRSTAVLSGILPAITAYGDAPPEEAAPNSQTAVEDFARTEPPPPVAVMTPKPPLHLEEEEGELPANDAVVDGGGAEVSPTPMTKEEMATKPTWSYFFSNPPEEKFPLYASVELLYLIAETTSLEYAQTYNQPASTVTYSAPNTIFTDVGGATYSISPDYGPGFQVALGGNLFHDAWKLELDWMQYSTEQSQTLVTPPGVGIISDLINPQQTPVAQGNVSAEWRLHFNVADLQLSRKFCVSDTITVTPLASVRGAWIRQHFDIVYSNVTASSGTYISSLDIFKHDTYNGYGVRGGFNVEWLLPEQFSLYANLAGSLLWSNLTTRMNENRGRGIINDLRSTTPLISPVAELAAGVRWSRYFDDNHYYLNLYAGWETLLWFRQFVEPRYKGFNFSLFRTVQDLSLFGVQVGLQFGF